MQLHNHEQRLIRNNCLKYLKPYFRNIVNTLNYSNATNRNEHAFQLLFVPLESTPRASARQHQQHNLVRDSCMVPLDRQDEDAKYQEIRDYKLMALETFNLFSLSLAIACAYVTVLGFQGFPTSVFI